MDCLNENEEVERFIKKHGIIPTKDEKTILALAILHGAIIYNEYLIKKRFGDK